MLPRVCHLTSQYPPVGQGGLGTHVFGLAQALSEQLPVEVISPVRWPGDPLDPETAIGWGLAVTPGAGAVLHAHNYEVALPALIGKALTGAPLVVTLHLPAPEQYLALERQLLEAADAVIAVSRSLAEEYRAHGWRMPVPTVIPNGVDAGFYHPEPGSRRAKETLLFAGRLVPQKGCDLAIRAFRALLPVFPALRLRVAGAGPWEQAYRNLARRLGCGDHVRWLGWLERSALREEYRRCTALLMPSRFEPFGLSALEAMACGAPVIASETGGLPEFITDRECGLLFPPAAPESLAAAVRRLWVDPALSARLRAAAVRRASQLTWEHAAAATLQVYRSLPTTSGVPRLDTGQRRSRAEEVVRAALQGEPARA